MAYNAGDVEAKLELDKSPFITGLKESLREAEAWKKKANKALKPEADIDQKPFNKALTAMQARLTKFAAKTYTAKVRIDDVGQLPKLTELSKRLTTLGQRVAKPKVSIQVDNTAFKAVTAELNALERKNVTVPLRIGVGAFRGDATYVETMLDRLTRDRTVGIRVDQERAGIEALEQRLKELSRVDRWIKIKLDLLQFRKDMAFVRQQLRDIERVRYVTIRVRSTIKSALAEMALVNAAANELDGKTVNVKANITGVRRMITDLGEANKAVAIADQGMSRYTKRLIWLGSAIAVIASPALGTLTTLLGTVPFVASAAGLSIGTIAAGMDGINDAMAPLAKSFESLQPPINAVFRDGLAPLVAQINTLMPMLGAAMVENAKVLVGWAGAFTDVVMQFNRLGILKQILVDINAGLKNLTPFITEITRSLFILADVGAETFGYLVVVLNKFALGFSTMLSAASASGVLQAAFAQLANVTDSLLYAFTYLMSAGFQAMATTGPGVADFIRNLTDFIVVLMPILSSLTNIFTSLFNPALESLTPIFAELQPAFKALEGVAISLGPFVSALGNHFAGLVSFLAPAVTWFLNLTTAVLDFLGPAAGPLVGVIMGIYGGIKLLNTVMAISNGLTWLFGGGMKAAVVGAKAYQGAMILARGATLLFSAALWTNPITWIVALIVGLIAAVVLLIVYWDEVTAALSASWTWIKNTFDTVWGAIGTWLTSTWASITAAFTASLTWIVNTWNSTWQAVGDFFTSIWTGISNFFTTTIPALWNQFVTAVGNGITAAIAWLAELPNNIAYWLGFAIGTVVRWAIDFGNAINAGITAAINWFAELPARIGTFLSNAGTWLMQTGTDLLTGLWNGIVTGWNATIAWFVALPGVIGTFFTDVGNWLWQTGSDILTGMWNGIVAGWHAVVAWFVGLPAAIGTFFTNAGTWLLQTGSDILNGLSTGIVNGWNATLAWFAGLPAAIGNFFVNAGTWLWNTGSDIINGLWTGIQNAWNGFMGWIGGLIDSFIAGFKAGLGIASPSTIFAQIGGFIIQGLINGIQMVLGLLMSVFSGIWQGLLAIASTAWNGIVNLLNAGLAFISNLWNTVWNGISSFFGSVWAGIQAQATTFWNAISAFFSGALNAFVGFWSGIWNNISAFFVGVWNGIKAQATILWNAISLYFTTALNMFIAFWTNVWNNILAFFVNIWNGIKLQATLLWNMISMFFTTALNAFLAFWSNLWNNILNFFVNLWNTLVASAIQLWNTLRGFWDTALAAFSSFWAGLWEGIKSTFQNIFSGIIDIAKNIWQTVKDVFRGSINAVIGGVNWPIDKINGLFGISIPRIPEIPPFATGGYVDWNVGAPKAPIGPVRGPGGPTSDRVLARLSNKEHVWSAREVEAAGGHDAMQRMRASVLHGGLPVSPLVSNDAASNINNMGNSTMMGYRKLQQMERKPNYDDIGRPTFAFGGVAPHVAEAGYEIERLFGRMPGGIGGVGARGNKSDHPSGHALDFMTLNNMPLGDRVAGHLMANKPRMGVTYTIWKQAINNGGGWSPMENRGSVTANHFDHVHASFTGGHGAGGETNVIDYGAIFDSMAGWLKKAGQDFVRGIIPVPPVPQWIEDWGVGTFDKGWDGLRKKAIELMQTVVGWLGGGGVGGDVEQWRPAVMASLARVGQPPAHADSTLRRMGKESGGNPRAINNWDSNAKKGTPSKGLMQVIDPTFAAHRDPGLPNDIWDPMANITASMKYALSRYGSLPAAYDKAGGYDSGGILPPGWTMAFNGTDDPEVVLTGEQWASLMDTATAARELVTNTTNNNGLAAADIERIISKLMETRPLVGSINPQLPQGANVKDVVDEVAFELRHMRRGVYDR